MEKFKIGGKVTLEDNTSYRIVDIIMQDDKEYFFCCTIEKPIEPKVFEIKKENDKVFIKFIENQEILKNIAMKILK